MTIRKTIYLILILIFSQSIQAEENKFPISGENVNVRQSPNISSQVITKLSMAELVTILEKKENIEILDGKKGTWILINTGKFKDSKELKGWVFDYYIAYPEKFKYVQNWKIKSFNRCRGDYCLSLIIDNNGYYTYSYEVCVDGNCRNSDQKCYSELEEKIKGGGFVRCKGKGRIQKYQNIIWLRNFDLPTNEYLYLKNNKLCMLGMEE